METRYRAIAGRPFTAAVLAVTLLGAGPGAQQPKGSPDQPAFRAAADLVIVDAVVIDRDGKPVNNLTADDFAVMDEGRRRPVSLFQTVSAAAIASQPQGTTRRLGYSTNVGVDARPTRAFVLFFDDLHLAQDDGDRAKAALAGFIERELEDGDLVSLVAPGSSLRWHARMPAGRAELERIVSGLRGLFAPDPSFEQMSDYEAYRISAFQDEIVANQVQRRWQNLRALGKEPANLATDKGFQPENRGGMIGLIPADIAIRANAVYQQAAARNRATLVALERTIDGLATVRGRKAVVLVSPGFIDDQERPADANRAIDAARRANVAVYFVDARGLLSGTPFAQAQFGSPLDSRDVNAANADLTLSAEGADNLASATGGFSMRNQNDLGRGLKRIGDESRVYYLLGFEPDRTNVKPGVFRRLEVKVARPGVTVRARRGYYAGDLPREARGADVLSVSNGDSRPTSSADGVDALARATESPYELGEIPLRATSYVFGDANPETSVVMLAVDADLRAFAFARKDNQLIDVAELRMLTTEVRTGKTERYERQVEMTFPSTARIGSDSWHTLAQEFRLAPGSYQARIALRDANSGRIGAVTHNFEVGPLTGLRLTTPILTDAIEGPPPGTAASPKPVLVVRRSFPAGATVYYQFGVLGAARNAAGAVAVTGSHVLRDKDGAVVKAMAPRPIVPGADGGLSRLAGLNLTGLPPGDYDLSITVRDEVAGQVVERREPFVILPAAPLPGSADR